jgi:hypothetical protein
MLILPWSARQRCIRRGTCDFFSISHRSADKSTLQDEENRLLYDDANGVQYGSFGEPAMSGDDTVEAQRESEALQRVVAKTSKSVFLLCL